MMRLKDARKTKNGQTLVDLKHTLRKTDIADSKWLAGLLRHGLLKGSFIPPEKVRERRELSRLRKKYTESLADYKRPMNWV
ncbi:Transposase [Desulfocicer vacuolatum DSM 3385]|uniref:Transposase n=2 Tax=Desulfocicer vacuolatum TaxID=2298 RepID=A0A1W2CWQ8_9BACT|nr:Transposase [Desulfocicer vacuolatum DSM 3385]